jgi:GNAT superfamily N-acetyltransferase
VSDRDADLTAFYADPGTLDRAVANCADVYRVWADRMGKHSRLWEDVSCADLELPVALPPNIAVVLRRPSRDEAKTLPERVAEFFAARAGGPYGIWSLWPLEGLPPEPLDLWHIPIMVRDVGGDGPVAPGELEILEATDASTVREAAALINESFDAQSEPEQLLTPDVLDDEFRTWVGRVDGRAVTTATAYTGEGFVGLYSVATTPDARGHGYGEAVTWAATLCRPELPATLQASPMGRPIYERMGYRTIAEFTVWDLAR